MFTINVADKHKVLSDLMNIFGKLHQKGFSDEQILNICHTFFKSEVEDNIDFCLKINKLESVLDKVKAELSGFKDFWRRLIKRFQTKVFDEEFENVPEEKRSYTIVAEDLERSGIFDDNDSDIVHNPRRKVLTNGELAEKQAKKEKHKNDYNLN